MEIKSESSNKRKGLRGGRKREETRGDIWTEIVGRSRVQESEHINNVENLFVIAYRKVDVLFQEILSLPQKTLNLPPFGEY